MKDRSGNIVTTYIQYFPNGNSSYDTTTYSVTVTQDASLNTWLNNDYFNNSNNNSNYLGTDKQYIVNHDFYVSSPGAPAGPESIEVDLEQEKEYIWFGKIGLIQATDYLKTSTNVASCINLYVACRSPYPCGVGNYLKLSNEFYWTISPYVWSTNRTVFFVRNDGVIGDATTYNNNLGVRPSFYLSSTVNLRGNGSTDLPYEIITG